MKLVCFVCVSLLLLLASAIASDVDDITIDQREVGANGVIPGLSAVQPEGVAGATFGKDMIAPDEITALTSTTNEDEWIGSGQVDSDWNKELVEKRQEQLANMKQQELKETLVLKKMLLFVKEQELEKELAQHEHLIQKLGERPVEQQIQEHEVYDGYVSANEEEDPKAAEDCEDRINYSMMAPNTAPPPAIRPKYPASPRPPTSLEALRPVVTLPSAHESGEELVLNSNSQHSLPKDVHTKMESKDFQSWSLETTLDATNVPDASDLENAANKAGDVVNLAKSNAQRILKSEFSGKSEVSNPESGMSATVAWSVMNSKGEHRFEPETEEPAALAEAKLYSPSVSPSPSAAVPREIYLEEKETPSHELQDQSYENQILLSHSQFMGNENEVTVHDRMMHETVVPVIERSFVGSMAHVKPIEPTRQRAALTGMGRDVSAKRKEFEDLSLLQTQTQKFRRHASSLSH